MNKFEEYGLPDSPSLGVLVSSFFFPLHALAPLPLRLCEKDSFSRLSSWDYSSWAPIVCICVCVWFCFSKIIRDIFIDSSWRRLNSRALLIYALRRKYNRSFESGMQKTRLPTNSPSKVDWSPTIILTMRRAVEMKLIISPNNKDQVLLLGIRDETVRRVKSNKSVWELEYECPFQFKGKVEYIFQRRAGRRGS